jgi:D-glycero-alpha-D-manno-heptose-7-phosphate kinase
MIISRTPLRVSFVGGGTDLPSFYRQFAGAVLSMSINKYVYLSMHDYFQEEGYILKYSQVEHPKTLNEIQHRIIKQVFSDMNIRGIDFNSSADVPAGTGMGSSSAFTVGLLNLCNAYTGRYISRSKLAELACDIEINKLGEPIGKQDQFGCALGGINFIRFLPDDTVIHETVPLTMAQKSQLESNLALFYLGGTRSASDLLNVQSKNSASDAQVIENLRAMAEQAESLRAELCTDVDCLGGYLKEGWDRKRALAPGISGPLVDNAYARAIAAGATGAKLMGAGGTGFLLVYAPGGNLSQVRDALKDFKTYQIKVDSSGSTIIYSD